MHGKSQGEVLGCPHTFAFEGWVDTMAGGCSLPVSLSIRFHTPTAARGSKHARAMSTMLEKKGEGGCVSVCPDSTNHIHSCCLKQIMVKGKKKRGKFVGVHIIWKRNREVLSCLGVGGHNKNEHAAQQKPAMRCEYKRLYPADQTMESNPPCRKRAIAY
jgi:hypothetical protein